MKKHILLLAIFFSGYIFGQNMEYNFESNYEYTQAIYQPIHFTDLSGMPDMNVDMIHYTITDNKGNQSEFIKEFDQNGNLIKYYKKEIDGKNIPIVELEYENENPICARSYKRGKLQHQTITKWNDNNSKTESVKTNRNGKQISKNIWKYNSNNCLTSSERYKRNQKLDKKWEYEYFDTNLRSRTNLYNGKGKLLSVWTYDCTQEGKKLTPKKDTVQKCQWKEEGSDFLIFVHQDFDDKGNLRKYITRQTLDNQLLENTTYDENDNILHHSTYNGCIEKPLKSETFNSKGEQRFLYEYKYENNLVKSYTFFYKGELSSRYENSYENKKLVEQKRYNRKDELIKTIKLEYGKALSNNAK